MGLLSSPKITRGSTRGNSLKLHQESLRLDIRKIFIIVKVSQYFNNLILEESLEVFKTYKYVPHGLVLSLVLLSLWLGSMITGVFSNLKYCMILLSNIEPHYSDLSGV